MILKNKKQDYDEKKVEVRGVITEYKSKPANRAGKLRTGFSKL